MKPLAVCMLLGWTSLVAAEPNPKAVAASLALTKLEPARGDAEGGSYIRIRGTGFLPATTDKTAEGPGSVFFGAHEGTVIRIQSDTELVVEAPGGKVGDVVDVRVVFKGRGEAQLPKSFTYVHKP